MGTPATLEEQKALAEIYCPEILERLRKAQQNIAARKYRRNKVRAGLGLKETVRSWVLRMRHEIAMEMEVIILDEEAHA